MMSTSRDAGGCRPGGHSRRGPYNRAARLPSRSWLNARWRSVRQRGRGPAGVPRTPWSARSVWPPLSFRLDICRYRYIMLDMARAATTADAFNAVAEPRRRQILDLLAGGERPVNDLVAQLQLAQPMVSKHLRVLREVGLVGVRDHGRQRLYRLEGPPGNPTPDWAKNYARSSAARLGRVDVVLGELKERRVAAAGCGQSAYSAVVAAG